MIIESFAQWRPIRTVPAYQTVLLYRLTDLYPVVGFYVGTDEVKGPLFMYQENGPEDGDHHQGHFLAFTPTHWATLPETPE